MSAGVGNKNTPVIHYAYQSGEMPVCKNKRYSYSTENKNEVTCKRCIDDIGKGDRMISIRPNNWASNVH